MPFYLTWIYKKGHCGNFIFQLSAHLSNEFEANIKKLDGYFWVLHIKSISRSVTAFEEIKALCKGSKPPLIAIIA